MSIRAGGGDPGGGWGGHPTTRGGGSTSPNRIKGCVFDSVSHPSTHTSGFWTPGNSCIGMISTPHKPSHGLLINLQLFHKVFIRKFFLFHKPSFSSKMLPNRLAASHEKINELSFLTQTPNWFQDWFCIHKAHVLLLTLAVQENAQLIYRICFFFSPLLLFSHFKVAVVNLRL